MTIKRFIQKTATAYLAMMIVPPIVYGTLKITDITVNAFKNKIKKSETIKDIKKDFELRRQGVITVDYQNIED